MAVNTTCVNGELAGLTWGLRYGLVNRPAGIGCLPRGLVYSLEERPARGQPHHDWARHGVMVTERPLTVEEMRCFELAPLVEGPLMHQMATAIAAGSMGEYAAEYLELQAEQPDQFRRTVLTATERVARGVYFSISDGEALAGLVLELFRQAAVMPGAASGDA